MENRNLEVPAWQVGSQWDQKHWGKRQAAGHL